MKLERVLHEKHKYRLMLCGHKAFEVGAVCLLLMVQGDPGRITLGHIAVASKTGLLAVFPALGISLTRHAHRLANKWTASILLGICGFFADIVTHPSHYEGVYLEAILTAIGTFALSIAISYTRIGKYVDGLAEAFLQREKPAASIAIS
jgi:hypothetical protein